MSASIQFLPVSSNSNGCQKAVAPVVIQSKLDVAVGTGSAAQDLLPAIASGSPAAFGGQVINNSCHEFLLTLTALDGDDCDECTAPDLLTPVDVLLTIPKGAAFPLPNGFYTTITAVALDSSGDPVDVQVAGKLHYYSCYQPCCSGGVLVP